MSARLDDTIRKKSASLRFIDGMDIYLAYVSLPATFMSGNNSKRSFIKTTQSNFAPLCAYMVRD